MAAPKIEDKSKEIEKRLSFRNALGKEIQSLIDQLAKKISELDEHDLETYHMLNKPDCLYGDSPMGRAFTHQHIKHYMIKRDLDFVGYFLDGKVNIPELKNKIEDASLWALRFKNPVEIQATGLKAIVQGKGK